MFYLFLALTIYLLFILIVAFLGSNYLIARRKPDPATSPKDYGLDFVEVNFTSSDGINLGGWYIPAMNSDRTIIFCAGANGSIDPDVIYVPWFQAANFNVLMFDWRAHGRSAGSITTLGYHERYDLIAAVEFAKSKGATQIGVLGFSMGGAVALSTAAVTPSIDAVAVDGAFVHVLSAVAGGLIERGVADWLAYSLARLFLLTTNLRLGINLFEIDPVRWIDRIAPRPLLLIYGDRDPYVSKTEIDQLADRAKEPKDIWRVVEATHRNIHVLRAEDYRIRLVQFFDQNLQSEQRNDPKF
jgi:fermentation-respiration switch protein FrsA (DUF1100 family)